MFFLEGAENAIAERAARLKEAVRQAGGPRAVARRSAIPEATLNNYLGGRDMKVNALVALAEATSVSIEWLATGRTPDQSNSKNPSDFFDPILLSHPAHFWGLHLALRTAREWFERTGNRPTLSDVLIWIGPVYRSSLSLPDQPVELIDPHNR